MNLEKLYDIVEKQEPKKGLSHEIGDFLGTVAELCFRLAFLVLIGKMVLSAI